MADHDGHTREGPCHHNIAAVMNSQGTKLWCLQNSKTSTPKLFNLCSPACFHGLKARPGTDEPTGRLALHGRCRIGPTFSSLDAGGGHRDGDSSHSALHGHPPPLHPGNESGCSHKACRLHASSISDSCLHFKGKDDCRQHHFMCISSGPFAYGELQRPVRVGPSPAPSPEGQELHLPCNSWLPTSGCFFKPASNTEKFQ